MPKNSENTYYKTSPNMDIAKLNYDINQYDVNHYYNVNYYYNINNEYNIDNNHNIDNQHHINDNTVPAATHRTMRY